MPDEVVSSDIAILDMLRKRESMTVSELADAMEVTATAVRQRLSRLMAQGVIERTAEKAGRGRPTHRYLLTAKGRRHAGENFVDLAMALWREVRSHQDPDIRDEFLERISRRLAAMYAERVDGVSVRERMEAVADLFRERKVPFEVQHSDEGPVLRALACPYADLADQDPAVCAMERMMFSEMLGATVHSTQCRLDGDRCCAFQAN